MDYQIIEGDCIKGMRMLEGQSVNCVVTSPPYFGLRDYGHDGQIGLEASPDEFVAKLVDVFREVRRVLRDDGTVWLNLGDSYTGYWGEKYAHKPFGSDRTADESTPPNKATAFKDWGMNNKNLIGIPWRVAFALQADGWYLRQDIIWHKPNPMPESVRDRCTKAHEYIFLLSKSERYYWDAEAMKESAVSKVQKRKRPNGLSVEHGKRSGVYRPNCGVSEYRNRRSVWSVTTKPYSGAHFATFPPDLIRPCILAGCPKDGTVLDPFGGSGTTALVALEEGRKAVLCELNTDYIALAHKRLEGLQLRIA